MDNVERINLVFGYAKPVPASSGLTIEGPLRNHRGLVFELLLVCIKDREREKEDATYYQRASRYNPFSEHPPPGNSNCWQYHGSGAV